MSGFGWWLLPANSELWQLWPLALWVLGALIRAPLREA